MAVRGLSFVTDGQTDGRNDGRTLTVSISPFNVVDGDENALQISILPNVRVSCMILVFMLAIFQIFT